MKVNTKGIQMKQLKMLLLTGMLTLFTTYAHAVPVNMAPIISYLLSDTVTETPISPFADFSNKTFYVVDDTYGSLYAWTFNADVTAITEVGATGDYFGGDGTAVSIDADSLYLLDWSDDYLIIESKTSDYIQINEYYGGQVYTTFKFFFTLSAAENYSGFTLTPPSVDATLAELANNKTISIFHNVNQTALSQMSYTLYSTDSWTNKQEITDAGNLSCSDLGDFVQFGDTIDMGDFIGNSYISASDPTKTCEETAYVNTSLLFYGSYSYASSYTLYIDTTTGGGADTTGNATLTELAGNKQIEIFNNINESTMSLYSEVFNLSNAYTNKQENIGTSDISCSDLGDFVLNSPIDAPSINGDYTNTVYYLESDIYTTCVEYNYVVGSADYGSYTYARSSTL